jgi:four helix bundle protein
MSRIHGDLVDRSFEFAVAVMNMANDIPRTGKGYIVERQLLRAGTSVGANIEEADNAFSDAEFAHSCNIARREAAETRYWLKLARRTHLLTGDHLEKLTGEADELARILAAIVRETRNKGRADPKASQTKHG